MADARGSEHVCVSTAATAAADTFELRRNQQCAQARVDASIFASANTHINYIYSPTGHDLFERGYAAPADRSVAAGGVRFFTSLADARSACLALGPECAGVCAFRAAALTLLDTTRGTVQCYLSMNRCDDTDDRGCDGQDEFVLCAQTSTSVRPPRLCFSFNHTVVF